MSISKTFFEKAYNELLQTIKEYDSDTFFAKGADLTEDEAYQLAGRCINFFMEKRLDGVMLDEMLDSMRS